MSQSMLRHRGGQIMNRFSWKFANAGNTDGAVHDDPVFDHLHNGIFQRNVWIVPGLLRGFLRIQHRTPLVLSALGAGVMGKLFLVAVRTLRNTGLGQKIVGAAVGSAARRVAPFRIRHDAIPFAFSPLRTALGPICISAGAERLKINDL
jgi:hypothetical protein